MSSRLVIVISFALASLAGCSGSSSDSSAATTTAPTDTTVAEPTTSTTAPVTELDPCSLVTHPEAEQLVGTALNPAERVEGMCTFTGPTTGPTAQVEIHVGDGAKKILDIDRDELGHAFVTVEGIGDEAHAEENAIFFRSSTTWVAIRVVLLNDPAENAARLEALARLAVTRT